MREGGSYTAAFLAPVLGRRENKRKKGGQQRRSDRWRPSSLLFLTTVTPVSNEHPYKADREAARSRGHLFSVATKGKRGARWIEVHTEIDDLHAAMMLSQNLLAYEVGIFVNGGFIYWTSIHPDLFNSTAINSRHSGSDVQS